MTIYLVDEPFAEIGLAYSTIDPEARTVLLQDGVYVARNREIRGDVFVLRDDLARRGLGDQALPPNVQVIGYEDLVDMMGKERVACFL